MKLSDAKKWLSCGYRDMEILSVTSTRFRVLVDETNKDGWDNFDITAKDVEFCLRQLALKVEREHKKARK